MQIEIDKSTLVVTTPDGKNLGQAVPPPDDSVLAFELDDAAVRKRLVGTEIIAGYCPMGCGQTLFVGEGGHLTCSYTECPDPTAVDTILSERETEHVVEIGEDSFTTKHPLRERLGDALLDCDIHNRISRSDGPPVEPGRYRVIVHKADAVSESFRSGAVGLDFERLPDGG